MFACPLAVSHISIVARLEAADRQDARNCIPRSSAIYRQTTEAQHTAEAGQKVRRHHLDLDSICPSAAQYSPNHGPQSASHRVDQARRTTTTASMQRDHRFRTCSPTSNMSWQAGRHLASRANGCHFWRVPLSYWPGCNNSTCQLTMIRQVRTDQRSVCKSDNDDRRRHAQRQATPTHRRSRRIKPSSADVAGMLWRQTPWMPPGGAALILPAVGFYCLE